MKPKVLVAFKAREEDKMIIENYLSGLAEVVYLHEISQDELDKVLYDVEIILTGSGRNLTEDILSKTPNLKFIQTLSAGVNAIPFHLLNDKVVVASNAGGNARAVAEYALALILSALKKIPLRDRFMRKGIWLRRMPHELISNKIIGIIGFGHIGKELAKKLKALGAKVYGINRSGRTDLEIDCIGDPNSLDYVLSMSDIVVITLPLTKHTKGLFNMNKFKLMKSNVIIVNVGRGEVIDQKDLFEFLKKNKEAIAALDVWWTYPRELDKETFQDYPFHELENVIMSPHVAGFSPDVRKEVFEHALINIKKFLLGEEIRNVVNKLDYI